MNRVMFSVGETAPNHNLLDCSYVECHYFVIFTDIAISVLLHTDDYYRQTSNISRVKSPNLYVSLFV